MRRIDRLISDGGFTLVELIVLLLVIAVIAVVAAPKMSSDPVSVATEAEQLAGDIRYVQTLAMTQAQRYRINLTATGYTFTLADGTAVIHPLTGSTAPINLNSGTTIGLPPTGLPNNLVAFDGRGVPYTDAPATTALAATASIVLSRGTASQQISISPETGKVTPP